ncbi:hypothetical protein GCM10010347_04020 [Streptomyces cirratus]|uniref:Integral-membrane protein n=1 Tax=Streptomyces cirratus TaxID=68187 RepID=A0ABQ3EHU5_9ACTN|nr:hypothetical protein [Streptomyces cirratus]GHB37902.1 hypothetical protein GCM10010347_04020 [Streptomyces cirratus]
MSDSRAPVRALRAAMFAAVCVALGAVGHSYMSGMDVPTTGLIGSFGVIGVLAWVAAGRRRGPFAITAALLAAQGAMHLVFTASQAAAPGSTPAATPAHHHMPGMDMSGMSAMATDTTGMAGMTGMTGHGHGGIGMIAAHVLAGVFCAAWLARGEAAVFRLAAALGATALVAARPLARALVLLRTRVVPVPAPPVYWAPYERPRRLRGAVPAHTVIRRGPPVRRDTRATAPGRPATA